MVFQLRDIKAHGVIGIGTDLLAESRISAIVARQPIKFAQRILTPAELSIWTQHPQPNNFLAKQFAAKEALSKALGTGIAAGVSFQHMEVLRDQLGAPCVELSAVAKQRMHALGATRALISLSDDQGFIQAFALILV